MKYNLTTHHEHEDCVHFFTFKIHQVGQIDPPHPPAGCFDPRGHMFDTPDLEQRTSFNSKCT